VISMCFGFVKINKISELSYFYVELLGLMSFIEKDKVIYTVDK